MLNEGTTILLFSSFFSTAANKQNLKNKQQKPQIYLQHLRF